MGSRGSPFELENPAGGAGDDDASASGQKKKKQQDEEEINVLVTGFGLFKAGFDLNPSWEVATRLPAQLPSSSSMKTSTTTTTTTSSTNNADDKTRNDPLPPVRINLHPEPIRVNFATVRSLVPTLWSQSPTTLPATAAAAAAAAAATPIDDNNTKKKKKRIDVAIHIGMAGPAPHYALERLAHKTGYTTLDVDGGLPGDVDDDDADRGIPDELETDVDIDDVIRRWRAFVPPGVDIRSSYDPGRYLCDWIYFRSLAHLYTHSERRRVVFLHVPADIREEALEKGSRVLEGLVRAVVESEWYSGGMKAGRMRGLT